MTNGNFTGIQIDMSGLRGIKIAKDGKTAELQGGVYGQLALDTLWASGYVTSES